MTFKKWILKFQDVDLDIGDLARDIRQDKNFPDSNDKGIILNYLETNAVDIVVKTFENAWDFYSKFYR